MKMNKKGEGFGLLLWENVIYLILLALTIFIVIAFINAQSNGAAVWEDYYAKEIIKVINFANPGEEISIDVQKATRIAKENGVKSYGEIFDFDNLRNEACVKLSAGRKTCYYYSNEVDIIDKDLKLGVPGNVLNFKIKDVAK